MDTTTVIPAQPASDLHDVPLACPRCRATLSAISQWQTIGVTCPGCGVRYAVQDGVPRFVPTDDSVRNFSFQWLTHRTTQLDRAPGGESERTFREKTGLTPEGVRGKLVLDAGCGMGRFAEVVSRWGGRVVAVDLSRAVEAARENLAGSTNVLVTQADLFHLPFPEGTFDIIYSIGVLHHTPDCEAAFRGLVRYLAPGGTMAVWLYADDGGFWSKCSDLYRRLTVKMPPRLLYAFCHAAIPAYYLFRIPVLGRLLWTLCPLSVHPDPAWRVLDTFDWYSPRYQSKHTYPQVHGWFQSEGLEQIRLLRIPVALSGVKPARHHRA